MKPPSRRIPPLRWLRLPLWLLALGTGAKSFADNPVLGSRRLNRAGLHAARIKLAHRMAWSRRRRLARDLPSEWRDQFDLQGYILLPDFLPQEKFRRLRDALFAEPLPSRVHRQGDTLTRRVPLGRAMMHRFPEIGRLIRDRRFRALLAYVASSRIEPLFYLQTIAGGVMDGPPDPQLQLHSDTFQPSMKAWLFLTDVAEDGRPFTYVEGSHLLTEERLAWERRKSIAVLDGDDVLSRRGSFRIGRDELAGLGLPGPRSFPVRANTLIVADTSGFHARADSHRPTYRVELWAYGRRTPFLPWTGLDPFALPFLSDRKVEWLGPLVDRLERLGLVKQHWRPEEPARLGQTED